jgi:glucose-6-phosphate 1-epimerase
MSNDVGALNRQFGIADQVVFKEMPGGMTVIEVHNGLADATISLQGAHVMTWAPKGVHPVIWLSRAATLASGKSIRGGVPICWPWFGPHATQASFPGHGFARTVSWEVVRTEATGGGATQLVFQLLGSEATRALWPHATECQLLVSVGSGLTVNLTTRNLGTDSVTVGDALHTYFEVGDVRRIAIHGLDGCPYLDKVDGGARRRQAGAVTIGAEVDRIYLDSSADCVIEDPSLGRRIRIAKRGSRSTVVWNPWIAKSEKLGDMGQSGYMNMVCVESANVDEDVVKVAPGESHSLQAVYTLEAL